jgi:putative transposase
MPRKNLIRQNLYPYHVTTRTNNKDWFKIPLAHVWDLFLNSLEFAYAKYKVKIHSFVLMSNHYHLLISTPNEDIDLFMMHLNREFSRLIESKSGRINHKFSNRYKWTIIGKESYLYNVSRYIYQNPVSAGICKMCIHYPYSSIHMEEFQFSSFQLDPIIKYSEAKEWYENEMPPENRKLIQSGLKHYKFAIAKNVSQKSQRFLEKGPRT